MPPLLFVFSEVLRVGNITFTNIALEDPVISNKTIVGAFTYTLIILALANFDKANIRFMKKSERLLQEKEKIASTDFLTKLPNRREFISKLKAKVKTNYFDHTYIAMAIIDLDKFKEMNDTFGHLAGDKLLRLVARSLKSIASDKALVCRLGGDEFGVCYLIDTPDDLDAKLLSLQAALPKKVRIRKADIQIASSMGVSVTSLQNLNVSQAFLEADYALYLAKKSDGNTRHIFNTEDKVEMQRRQSIFKTVKAAIAAEDIPSVYQLIRMNQGHAHMVEALLRIKDKAGNCLCPLECLDAVQHFGLVTEFTRIQLKSAILDVMAVSPDLLLTFNLSPPQLTDSNLLNILTTTLKETSFPPERLILEISELTAQSIIDSAKQKFEEINSFGIRIAIDDFGIGNTGYQIFKHIKVDFVKADKSLLTKDYSATVNHIIVRQIVDFCNALGIKSICEGIEDMRQIERMNEYNFDYFQGYAISRPGNLVEQLLKAKKQLSKTRNPILKIASN